MRRILESRFQDFVERPVLEMYDACWTGRDAADPTTELLQLLRNMQITAITGGHFFCCICVWMTQHLEETDSTRMRRVARPTSRNIYREAPHPTELHILRRTPAMPGYEEIELDMCTQESWAMWPEPQGVAEPDEACRKVAFLQGHRLMIFELESKGGPPLQARRHPHLSYAVEGQGRLGAGKHDTNVDGH